MEPDFEVNCAKTTGVQASQFPRNSAEMTAGDSGGSRILNQTAASLRMSLPIAMCKSHCSVAPTI